MYRVRGKTAMHEKKHQEGKKRRLSVSNFCIICNARQSRLASLKTTIDIDKKNIKM